MTSKSSENSTLDQKVSEAGESWPCDWKSHEFQQLRRGAEKTFRENLIWLEQATEFADKLLKAPLIKHAGFPKIISKV